MCKLYKQEKVKQQPPLGWSQPVREAGHLFPICVYVLCHVHMSPFQKYKSVTENEMFYIWPHVLKYCFPKKL